MEPITACRASTESLAENSDVAWSLLFLFGMEDESFVDLETSTTSFVAALSRDKDLRCDVDAVTRLGDTETGGVLIANADTSHAKRTWLAMMNGKKILDRFDRDDGGESNIFFATRQEVVSILSQNGCHFIDVAESK